MESFSKAKFNHLLLDHAHVDFPSTLLPKWQKRLPHKLHSHPHLPMETTSYGEAWRAFRKQNSITYYSTVPITCTQIVEAQFTTTYRYNKLHCNDISRWYIVLLCKISLQRSLARMISRRDIAKIVPISRWFIVVTFGNPSMFRWYIGDKSQEQRAIFIDYRLHYFCTVLYEQQ